MDAATNPNASSAFALYACESVPGVRATQKAMIFLSQLRKWSGRVELVGGKEGSTTPHAWGGGGGSLPDLAAGRKRATILFGVRE